MPDIKGILDAAFADAVKQGEGLSSEYRSRLDGYRVNAARLVDDLATGTITLAEAQVAGEQYRNAVASTLLSGALATQKAAGEAALSVVSAVLRAVLLAAI